MHIEAVYDFLCPWCLIAKRELALALEQEGDDGVGISWHQFMLYPEFDRAGHDFLAQFRARYGEELQVPMWDRVRSVGAPLGIDFAFEQITRGPASIDGHRLVRWAEKQRPGSAGALIEDIARGFYERAELIDFAFLARTAAAHGFDEVAALAHLESDDDLAEPFAETEEWRRRGVTSMPHFRLHFSDGRTETLTTTSVDAFANALRRDREFAPLAATGS
ncbi:DsbA family protein [Erythrobacter sp. NFXS35]|uniref:DsbA family oxidoreductase n=1 Tax=Erythrobacter sp. NFXS35 TaxID=2818436 RepID=UPI0032DEC296